MTIRLLGALLAVVLLPVHRSSQPDASKWKLVWSDEFNAADGTAPDPAKWGFDLGGGGWGNKELESYTSRPVNVQQKGGNLVITALKEDYTGKDGVARPYTSARISIR